MRAARFHSYGAPSVLVVEDAPEPHAAEGSIRIAVRAVSVNPIDYMLRAGHLARAFPMDPPIIPGRDAVGVVDEIGPGVSGVHLGDIVFGLGGVADTTAEFAVLTAWSHVPDQWTVEQAAAAGLAASTAVGALNALGDVSDSTILIEGASGAVGSAAAALALGAGATVIGTGSESSRPFLESLGVLATTYGRGLAERVAALAPAGVDFGLHMAPSNSLADVVEIVGDGSKVVTVVDHQGAADFGTKMAHGINDSARLEQAVEAGRRGQWVPRVDQVFALADIAEAHSVAESISGKVVVTVNER